jgi:citrate synthase
MYNVIFAISRSTGWIAHWREMMSEGVIKIGRPRQLYVGNNLKKFEDIETRKDAPGFSMKRRTE